MKTLRRTIHPEVRVLDEKAGIVEYIASNETLDSYREVIKADGWRFDEFDKNAPFVDSHNYESVGCLLGKVIDHQVKGRQLIETVKWAIDAGLPEDHLANIGFKMTQAGYLKAVSVGFMPVSYATKYDSNKSNWQAALDAVGIKEDTGVRCIYLEQQQKELSACVIGANPDAVAKAYKAGILSDKSLESFSNEYAKRETANITDDPADVMMARQQARNRFLLELQFRINEL